MWSTRLQAKQLKKKSKERERYAQYHSQLHCFVSIVWIRAVNVNSYSVQFHQEYSKNAKPGEQPKSKKSKRTKRGIEHIGKHGKLKNRARTPASAYPVCIFDTCNLQYGLAMRKTAGVPCGIVYLNSRMIRKPIREVMPVTKLPHSRSTTVMSTGQSFTVARLVRS